MLHIRNLQVQRGEHRVILPELDLQPGEIRAITGESGCGKSTLLESIGLLLQPEQLDSYQLGRDPVNIGQLLQRQQAAALADIRARHLGFVLQSGGLLPFLDVRQNISLPRRLLGLPGHSRTLDQAVSALKLEGLLHKLPQALSIGERQRVACVRAIAHEPQLLLADEPTAALDPGNARRLLQLLLELVERLQLSALIVSHDWALLQEYGMQRLCAVNQQGATRFEIMA
ncbi:ABC transporter ATP-binding protein [Halopseudomonas yangmingensis]|uniref:Putative ABC transport system ATP-binding protein n=1 Tax=Halopseudomonas yangmingensis TaxID=1720063 RepID=A0A1I4P715_9GAMM|nr:ATP-binding cassette domain-containing protein [Halopseudomonas yangmingensis]SFM23581.1 putative ABC transport system ATP-binding protein [Halopseudomonas yangmingensis]